MAREMQFFWLVNMAELLQISHWQSLQTCAPMAFSLAPSHQQTPANTQRTVYCNCIQIYHIHNSNYMYNSTRRHSQHLNNTEHLSNLSALCLCLLPSYSFTISNTQSKACSIDVSLWKPGWLKDVPWTSSLRWCPDPRGRRNGYDVYWRYEAWPGSASWCCFLYGLTPVTVIITENMNAMEFES